MTVSAPSRYGIGDLQGCLDPLVLLKDLIGFSAVAGDQLWLVGDLVNRGPQSIETLRYVKAMGDSVRVVLGNHDLAVLAGAGGVPAKWEKIPLVQELLDAPDGTELVDWLRHQPLMHVEGEFAMVHAGLLPQWNVAQARALAAEVEAQLRGPDWRDFMQNMFGSEPAAWSDSLQGWDRLRVIVNAMTRMRFITPAGEMRMKAKGAPEDAPEGLLPWYMAPEAAWQTHTVLFGHWSAMDYRDLGHVIGLDSGCVWGGCLSAVRLEDRQRFSVDCPQYADMSGGD